MMTIAHQTARYSDMKLTHLFAQAADIALHNFLRDLRRAYRRYQNARFRRWMRVNHVVFRDSRDWQRDFSEGMRR